MANTAELLTLISEFPDAFTDPALGIQTSVAKSTGSISDGTQKLLELMEDFPEPFTDPESPAATPPATSESSKSEITDTYTSALAAPVSSTPPTGYNFALQRQFPTFTWGTINIALTYSSEGLQSIWVTVGKSGTETQSLCEGICRLANLLLTQKVPVSAIARELRGIRGADSEGLGPNRILGLADLIGKALQEAPETFNFGEPVVATPIARAVSPIVEEPSLSKASSNGSQLSDTLPTATADHISQNQNGWAAVSEQNHRMGICPECGSELQAANGCSGGACLVCGYSSCS
jgi:hypothetical protein